jgi:hypothetical protein
MSTGTSDDDHPSVEDRKKNTCIVEEVHADMHPNDESRNNCRSHGLHWVIRQIGKRNFFPDQSYVVDEAIYKHHEGIEALHTCPKQVLVAKSEVYVDIDKC